MIIKFVNKEYKVVSSSVLKSMRSTDCLLSSFEISNTDAISDDAGLVPRLLTEDVLKK